MKIEGDINVTEKMGRIQDPLNNCYDNVSTPWKCALLRAQFLGFLLASEYDWKRPRSAVPEAKMTTHVA